MVPLGHNGWVYMVSLQRNIKNSLSQLCSCYAGHMRGQGSIGCCKSCIEVLMQLQFLLPKRSKKLGGVSPWALQATYAVINPYVMIHM